MPKSIQKKKKKNVSQSIPKKYHATNQVVLTKRVHRNMKARKVYLLIQPGNQAVFTPTPCNRVLQSMIFPR